MGYFKRFIEWQNYVHYFLLVVGIYLIYRYLGINFDFKMFSILFMASFIIDSIIHLTFWFVPEPYRWRD